MITVFAALLVGGLGFLLGKSQFGVGSGVFVALVGTIATYILLARRIGKRVEGVMKAVEEHLSSQRAEKALELLESLRPLRLWQPMLGPWVDAQIGVIHFTSGRPDDARPYLERAPLRMWQGKAMLAAHLWRIKSYDEMERVFERTSNANKKVSLVWAAYAWCQWKRGKRDQALQVLARGRAALPADARLQKATEALQNMKKPKMRVYGNEWLALGLEEVPGAGMVSQASGQRPLPPWARRAYGGRQRR